MFHKGYSQEDEDKTSPNDLFWFSHNGKIINPDETSGPNEDLPFENLKRPRQNPFCPIWSCPSPLLCTWRERRLSDCHSKASCGVPPGRGEGGSTPQPTLTAWPAAWILSSLRRTHRGCARLPSRRVWRPFRADAHPSVATWAQANGMSVILRGTRLCADTLRDPCRIVQHTAYRDIFPYYFTDNDFHYRKKENINKQKENKMIIYSRSKHSLWCVEWESSQITSFGEAYLSLQNSFFSCNFPSLDYSRVNNTLWLYLNQPVESKYTHAYNFRVHGSM